MKHKTLSVVMLLLLAVSLSSCGRSIRIGAESTLAVDTKPGVQMTVLKSTASSAAYRISSETDEVIITGNANALWIEVLQDGVWRQINAEELPSTAEAYLITREHPLEMRANWSRSYGELPAGHYRILKRCFPEADPEDSFLLSAEFDIR